MAEAVVQLQAKPWNKLVKNTKLFFKTSYPKLRAAVATHGFRDIIDHFKKEQAPKGRWKPRLARTNRRYDEIRRGDSNIRGKSMYRSSNKILQLSGDLRKSFMQGNINQQKRGNFATLMFTNVPYAGTHNSGDPSRNIAKREFMWLSRNAQEKILNTLMNDLERAIKR